MNVSNALRDALKARGFQYLQAELQTGGFSRDLSLIGNELRNVAENGTLAELASGAQTIVTNHVPPAAVDFGADVVNLVDIEQVRTYATAAKTFLGNATPTNAQVLAQVQRNTRAILTLLRVVAGG